MKMASRILMISAALSLISGSASAATICVNPSYASCEATLQDGINAAAAGDTVSLAAGVYFENVTIPAGKDGLTIRGGRSAILDAGDDGLAVVPNAAEAIVVGSNDVEIRGITIRNGDTDQILISDMVTGTMVRNVLSVNSDENFVTSDVGGNDGTSVTGCDVFFPDGSAADLAGNNLVVSRNDIRQTSDDGISLSGDDVIVEKNHLTGIENGDAIGVSGNNAEIINNRMRAVDDAGIDVNGDDALIRSNRISGSYYGMEVSGDRPMVTSNRLDGIVSGGTALYLDCTDCTTAVVKGNVVRNAGDDTEGYSLGTTAGAVVSQNIARDVIDTGFDLSATGTTFHGNRAENIGGDGEDCFEISGDDNVFTSNRASYCMGSGFNIFGDRNSLQRNRVTRAAENGFAVNISRTDNELTSNHSVNAGMIGFFIADGGSPATATILENNTARGSRYDGCDEGLGTVRSGNNFGTELAVVQDGTTDCPTDF